MGGSQPAELPFVVGNFRRICSWMFNVAHYGWMVDSMTLQSQWEIDEFPHVLLLPSTYTYKHKKTYVAAGKDWHEEIKYRNFASSLRRFNSLSLTLSLWWIRKRSEALADDFIQQHCSPYYRDSSGASATDKEKLSTVAAAAVFALMNAVVWFNYRIPYCLIRK